MINFIKKIFTRNYAVSDMHQAATRQPVYTDFTVQKAVREGLKCNVWVYRCINLITQAAAAISWYVERNGEPVEDHPFNTLIDHPNEFLSRQQFFELIIEWILIAGNAYVKKVIVGGKTVELWPISPDRLSPVPAADVTKWIDGYALDYESNIKYLPNEIIHLSAIQDPSNPLVGLSPLRAAGRIIDADNAQQDFNTAAMQNQGSVSGVWTFERSFANQKESDVIATKLNERYSGVDNAKRMVVIGSNAKFQQTTMTPKELDFLESRKTNRNEIFLAFGVPPAYGGSEKASTYNNYQSSELIFWNQTIIPLLKDIRDIFNHSFSNELNDKEKITYDISNVDALRTALLEKSKTAKIFSEIGVPFDQVNKKFQFGFSEYEGWDESTSSVSQSVSQPVIENSKKYTLAVRSAKDTSEEIEKIATEDIFNRFYSFFENQKEKVLLDIEKHDGVNIRDIIEVDIDNFKEIMGTAYSDVAGIFADKIIIEKRDAADNIITQIMSDILKIVGIEEGLITETTINTVQEQITQGLEDGWSMKEFQQAIIDTGVFSPERALLIARTVSTGAANLGQITGAMETGATHKVWSTSGFKVRDSHAKMEGVKVPINDNFIVGGYKAMYPGDHTLPAAERCNCFLPGTKIQGEIIKGMESKYSGEAVEVIIAGGNILRVSRNHPILTKSGFVPAYSLHSGNQVVTHKREIERPVIVDGFSWPSVPPYKNNIPPFCEDLFSSLSMIGFSKFPRGCASDFYGDGKFVDGNINVVFLYRELLQNMNPSNFKGVSELIFKSPNSGFVLKSEGGTPCHGLSGVFAPSSFLPGSRHLPSDESAIFFDGLPFDLFSFALCSEGRSRIVEDSGYYGSTCVKLFSQFIDTDSALILTDYFNTFGLNPLVSSVWTNPSGSSEGDVVFIKNLIEGGDANTIARNNGVDIFPSQITLDDVVSVNHFQYSGNVYDFETKKGWLIADGVYTSNCRCSLNYTIE